MIAEIVNNKYIKTAELKDVKMSKNKEFFIWTFVDVSNGEKIVGFTPSTVYFGGKTHVWYSTIIGYYLPVSYNINFDNIKEKKCHVALRSRGSVARIIPIQENNPKSVEEKVEEAPKDDNFVQNDNKNPDEELFE